MRCGVAGMSIWRMPCSAKASTTAFITAGSEPAQPASPQPLTPRILVVAGTGWLTKVKFGTSGAQPLGELHDADRAVGADDGEIAGGELDIGDRGFEHEGGDRLAALDHLLAGLDDGGAARHHRFRAAGAAAGDQLVAVALDEA